MYGGKSKRYCSCQETTTRATLPGERLFTDISGPFAESIIKNKYWIMVVDNCSRMKWSFFRKKKSDIGQALDGFLTQLRGIGYETKYLRCDNAGENTRQLSDLCKRLGIKIELTAPHTAPQMNGVVERAIVTVCQRAMAMMFSACFTDQAQKALGQSRWYLGTTWAPGWAPGHLGTWAPGHLAAWAPGCLGTWLPGHLAAWAPRHLGTC